MTYFGQNLRPTDQPTPSTPNDLINTDDGRFVFSMWTAKVNGSYEAPWSIRLTPALRFQSGQPYGRTILASSAYGIGGTGGINYGTARILMEPIGTRKQDDILIFDIRAEKYFNLGSSSRRFGVFMDVYNITNSDAQQNITWNSGCALRAAQLDRPADHRPLRHEVRLVAGAGWSKTAKGREATPGPLHVRRRARWDSGPGTGVPVRHLSRGIRTSPRH